MPASQDSAQDVLGSNRLLASWVSWSLNCRLPGRASWLDGSLGRNPSPRGHIPGPLSLYQDDPEVFRGLGSPSAFCHGCSLDLFTVGIFCSVVREDCRLVLGVLGCTYPNTPWKQDTGRREGGCKWVTNGNGPLPYCTHTLHVYIIKRYFTYIPASRTHERFLFVGPL